MSLKEETRKRILEDVIRSVKPASGWKVLIVDYESMRIINAAVRMYDIMEEGVTLVEKIDIERQPLPKMDAIYLLTPKPDVIDKLIKDFKNPKDPQYGAVYLYFTSRLDDKEFQRIKKEPHLLARIKCLKEINVDFLAHESQMFHFDSPDYFKSIYSPESTESGAALQKMAEKIASVCATLKEYPVVRYGKSHNLSHTLASFVQDRLDDLMRTSSDFASTANVNPSSRATLLILDRSVDVLAPLLHEFTYQAMVYDLLDVDEKDHFKYNAMTTGGENKSKEIVLGETDPLWPTIRHLHIADTINWILDGFNDFVKENKAAKFSKKEKVNDLKEMSEAMKQMPQYQEMLGKYSIHINMANQCMSIFNNRGLNKLAGLEQDMATGEDADGKAIKNILSNLAPLLTDSTISLDDKLRLLMLYIVSQEGIKDSDRKRLLDLAKISHDDQGCISNLRFLGVTLLKAAKKKTQKQQEKKKAKKQRDDAPAYDLSRYTPQVKIIGQELLENSLSPDEFPFIKEDPSALDTTSALNEPKSLRKDKAAPKWANKDKRKTEKVTGTGNRVIIFVAGGVTFSEMRSVYELTKKSNREVIIGSSSIIIPKKFVQNLRELKSQENMNEDTL